MKDSFKSGGLLGAIIDPVSGYQQYAASKKKPSATGGPQPMDALSIQESEADVERKRLLSEQMARTRAARRGGYRALLSQERYAPETGLQTTLGVG